MEKIDKVIAKLNQMEKKLDQLTKDNKQLMEDNKKLMDAMSRKDDEIKSLRREVDLLQQRSRVNNLEIGNFPVTQHENPVEIVLAIASTVGVQLTEEDIQAGHRVPRYDKDATKNIVVQFCSRWKKNILLNACTKYRKDHENKISAKDIKNTLPDQSIYISEHLTPKNKKLLKATKDKAKDVHWKYVWTKDGCIFARKDEADKRRTTITQEEDLLNMQ